MEHPASTYYIIDNFVCQPPDAFVRPPEESAPGFSSLIEESDCAGCRTASTDESSLHFIQEFADAGCEICQIALFTASWCFEDSWQNYHQANVADKSLSLRDTKVQWDGDYLHVSSVGGSGRDRRMEFVSGRLGDSEQSRLPFAQSKPLITQPGSDEAIQTINSWSSACAKHLACPVTSDVSLPKRAIDVVCADPDVVLVETDGQTGKYICLSYVWGEEQQRMTTVQNYGQHTSLISLTDLSQTAKEAVALTRRLGIRWLWIDAICIIQDDRHDWEVEAAKMYSIFQNSWLTLSATTSRGSSDGLTSTMSVGPQFEVPILKEQQPSMSIYSREWNPRQCGEIRGTTGVGWYYSNLHLLGRAWTLQERLISPRQVHFGHGEMIWECQSGVMCECSPGETAVSHNFNLKTLFHQRRTREMSGEIKPASLTVWHQLSQRYFSCGITRPEDRLPAISGLARLCQKTYPELGDYLAGLWTSDLPGGLLWWSKTGIIFHDDYGYNPVEFRPLDRHHAAPSWSWASICGDTKFAALLFGLDDHPDIRNIEILA